MPLILSGDTGISGVDGTAGTPSLQGTDSNTGVFYATDIVGIATNGTERMRIDSSGNVGIGNTPSGTSATGYRSLELGTTAGTGITANNGDFYIPVNAYVAGGAWKYATTLTASLLNINTTTLIWQNAVSGTAGNNISLSERMRVNSFGIGLGGSTPSSGTGITFPATQSASSDANTLDDYEEGTWTPVVKGSTSDGTASYSAQYARYTKVGRMVFVEFYLTWSGGTGTGNLFIDGLPFSSAGSTTYPSLAIGYWQDIAITSGQVPMSYVNSGNTRIEFICMNAGGVGTTAVTYDAAGSLQIAGCYTV